MKGSIRLAVAFALLGVASAAWADGGGGADRDEHAGGDGFEYTVVRGDTLSEIAVRLHVSVDDLCRWNEGLEPDRIRRGQRLRILNGRRRIEHRVTRGETLSGIAAHWRVGIEEILRWNRGLRPNRLTVGRRLRIYTPVPESRSQSVGTPQRGRLRQGRRMPLRHRAFRVRAPERAWGTDETVRWIVAGYQAVHRAFDGTKPVAVHDLSSRRGGRLNGHASHASGRDADIAYFQRRCGDMCEFRRIGPDDLDAARQWKLFAHWIDRDQVEAIFMDHRLQERLYREARRQGVGPRARSRIFQYPRPVTDRYGIIRHHRRHDDHFHVRFRCHSSDPDCR